MERPTFVISLFEQMHVHAFETSVVLYIYTYTYTLYMYDHGYYGLSDLVALRLLQPANSLFADKRRRLHNSLTLEHTAIGKI